MRLHRVRAAVLVLPAVLVGCADEAPRIEEALRPVRTEAASGGGAERLRTFTGTARAASESRLSFRVAGTIVELAVNVGDTVRKGELIAALDLRDYQLQVEEAQASLAQAQAARRNAERERDRVRELYENDNASVSQYDQARSAAESAIAQVTSISKRLELSRRQLDYTRLTAPVDGSIARVSVEENENVQPGQAIVTLTSGARAKVEVSVPGTLITGISEGDRVTVAFDALPSRRFDAMVTEVGVTATGTTTFPVTVELAQAAPNVLPGMAAEVTFAFPSGEADGRLVVPAVAVGEDRDGRFVFTVEPKDDGTAIVRRRAVTVGELTPSGIEVLDGLAAGDVIVTAGVRRLADGRRVRLTEEAGPAQ